MRCVHVLSRCFVPAAVLTILIAALPFTGCGLTTPSAGSDYAGAWEGAYTGVTDSGTFTLEIPATGRLQFTGTSNLSSYAGTFAGDGRCSSSGSLDAEAEISAIITLYTIRLDGNLAPSGNGSGTFTSSTALGIPIGSGSFTVQRTVRAN